MNIAFILEKSIRKMIIWLEMKKVEKIHWKSCTIFYLKM